MQTSHVSLNDHQNLTNRCVSCPELASFFEMDPSYITHQRRPALIPPESSLSAEDEHSIAMRIGSLQLSAQKLNQSAVRECDQRPSLSLDAEDKANSGKKGRGHCADAKEAEQGSKRKASTTPEEYRLTSFAAERDEASQSVGPVNDDHVFGGRP